MTGQWRMAHPGLLAPASLKLDLAPQQVLLLPLASGASCPGLIEATTVGNNGDPAARASGASCPGLIEAPATSVLANWLRTRIRGFLPRPH